MTLDKKEINTIITACFESEEMKEYLTEHCEDLSHFQLVQIIKGAPIPLSEKADLMRSVDGGCYREMKDALDALDLREDQFFLYHWLGHERIDGNMEMDGDCIGPYRGLDRVREHLRKYMFYAPEGENL